MINLSAYREPLKFYTGHTFKEVDLFLLFIGLRLDKPLSEIDRHNAEECMKYSGMYHYARFLMLLELAQKAGE